MRIKIRIAPSGQGAHRERSGSFFPTTMKRCARAGAIPEGPRGVVHRTAVPVKGEDNGGGVGPGAGRRVNERLADDSVHGPLLAIERLSGSYRAASEQNNEGKEENKQGGRRHCLRGIGPKVHLERRVVAVIYSGGDPVHGVG